MLDKTEKELLGTPLSVRLTSITRNKLSVLARKRGMSPSSLARFWLEERIKKEDNNKKGD
jgi:predicted transcriptional regulator